MNSVRKSRGGLGGVSDYASVIASAAAANGVDPAVLTALLQQESGGNPNAVNANSGALGIAQFMPATAAGLGVNPLDPVSAINGAAQYLAQLTNQFGSTQLGLAAYNWGPGNLQKWLNGQIANWPSETQNYVNSILGSSSSLPTVTPSAVSSITDLMGTSSPDLTSGASSVWPLVLLGVVGFLVVREIV